MQPQHACIAQMQFNVPSGDTQLTYFLLSKILYVCRVALALLCQETNDMKNTWVTENQPPPQKKILQGAARCKYLLCVSWIRWRPGDGSLFGE